MRCWDVQLLDRSGAIGRPRSLDQAIRLPLSREDRSATTPYVPATDWRLRRRVLRHQDGRDKEVDVGENLTVRDGFRLKAWQAGVLSLLLALVFGGIRAGASWGASGYD